MSNTYIKKTEALLEEIKNSTAQIFEVLKVEWVCEDNQYYLRVYCNNDKEGGIGAEDLAKISRPLSRLLDREDFIKEEYTLEVCSPGYMEDVKTQDDYDISQLDDETIDQEDQGNE